MSCHFCKTETTNKKQQISLDIGRPISVPITMTVTLCDPCTVIIGTTGLPKVRNTKWVLAL